MTQENKSTSASHLEGKIYDNGNGVQMNDTVLEVKDNTLKVGGAVYELEAVGENITHAFAENTPVVLFNGKSYVGKALPNERPKPSNDVLYKFPNGSTWKVDGAPDEPKPTFQILSFRSKESPQVVYELGEGGEYVNRRVAHFTRSYNYLMSNNRFEIYSVRNSKGLEITVDKVYNGNPTYINFPKQSKVARLYMENGFVFAELLDHAYIAGVNEFEEEVKEPLFITEDGLPIFDEESVVWVVYNGEGSAWQVTYYVAKFCMRPKGDLKVFSIKQKAEAYVRMNKPVLSLADIMQELLKENDLIFPTHSEEKNKHRNLLINFYKNLEEIVASKLKAEA